MLDFHRQLASGAPRKEVIEALLVAVRKVSESDVAAFFTLGSGTDGILRFVDVIGNGPAAAVRVIGGIDGIPYSDLVTPPESISHAPPMGRWVAYDRSAADLELHRRIWDPIGAHAAATLNSQDRYGRYLGQVVAFRTGTSPEFSDAILARLRRLQPEIHAALSTTAPPSGHPAEEMFLFRRSGELWMRREGAEPHHSAEFLDAIGALVPAALRNPETPLDQFVDNALVRAIVLEGEDAGVLVIAQKLGPVQLHKVYGMSPAVRKVIAMACQGATAPEIAERLGRSPETVRSHLKRAYAELGVSSRAELASLVEAAITSSE